ncbi:AAA family ATPase [Gordonia sp. 'Campus']|uniref:AAA family ATPase n=1 Tax=Gordonia sp. 'Campus' TaxID=2915824 RepID=UPI001EE440D3|nr:AAA family ATPase [Gordonia sp. 'Campus']
MTEELTRKVHLRRATDVHDDVPTWAWEYNGRGRIALGTAALFAGRPGAGKSTSARWLSSQVTVGTLDGCWLGKPSNVAYIAREEAVEYIVKPSFRAHGADLGRVYFPEVVERYGDDDEQILSAVTTHDIHALTEQLIAAEVRLVVVDPLMSMLGAKADVNRNNEVRAILDPWRRLAEVIDGVVLGVAHLNKAGNGDVVAGINGSSAFGEIARAVFGFAKDPTSDDGERVLSQEKNSLGDESLALRYRIESTTVQTASGKSADVARFVILGDSDKSVGDVLREASRGAMDKSDQPIDAWLLELLETGPSWHEDIVEEAGGNGWSKDQLRRSKDRINAAGTVIRAVKSGGKGAPWFWLRGDLVGTVLAEGGLYASEPPPLPALPSKQVGGSVSPGVTSNDGNLGKDGGPESDRGTSAETAALPLSACSVCGRPCKPTIKAHVECLTDRESA